MDLFPARDLDGRCLLAGPTLLVAAPLLLALASCAADEPPPPPPKPPTAFQASYDILAAGDPVGRETSELVIAPDGSVRIQGAREGPGAIEMTFFTTREGRERELRLRDADGGEGRELTVEWEVGSIRILQRSPGEPDRELVQGDPGGGFLMSIMASLWGFFRRTSLDPREEREIQLLYVDSATLAVEKRRAILARKEDEAVKVGDEIRPVRRYQLSNLPGGNWHFACTLEGMPVSLELSGPPALRVVLKEKGEERGLDR